MANIDVTQLFTDPDFCDPMKVITRVATVTSKGENLIKETSTLGVGSIQPIDGKALKRLPQSMQVEDLRSFWTNGQIADTEGCEYPSILVFQGRRYIVKHVFPWSNWGQGWTEGVCVAEALS